MAQKVSITLVDDIDGKDANETVMFRLDGKEYAIDLSAQNAVKLRDALTPYIDKGRKTGGRPRSSVRATPGGAAASEIRDWARANGFNNISDRGRVSATVREAYLAAH
jgi:hypothetical protein